MAALPRDFWGPQAEAHPFAFTIFVGLNLANSAIPVLARILMDLRCSAAASGRSALRLPSWTTSSRGPSSRWFSWDSRRPREGSGGCRSRSRWRSCSPWLVVSLGRRFGPPWLAWLKRHLPWPEGFIAATAVLLLAAAAAAEAAGVHAALGALLLGVALGGDDAEHQEAHDVVARFALGLFAPLYFVSLGLSTDFVQSFDAALVAVVVAAAIVSKLLGVLLGAKLAGMRADRDAWAIGFGLNARGATGIILAAVGHAAGVIDDRMFVALAVMAFLTSLLAGPAMSRLLRPAAQSDL